MQFWKRTTSAQKRIYADAAAATPLSKIAKDELMRLLDVYGNAGALHKEGVEAKAELERARESIAQSIGAHADEIIFTASGTEANNLAIQGMLRPLLQHPPAGGGELHAITSAIEHQSVLEPLLAMESEGLYLTILEVDKDGFVDPEALRAAINDETVFVSVQLVNSEIGTIEPIKELVKEVRSERRRRSDIAATLPIYFHTDASQAPLWMKVGVEQLGVDLLTLDAQKVLGPKGIGALFIRRGTLVDPIIWGGSQEFGLRGGTPNVPLAGSFAVALVEAQRDVEERSRMAAAVRDYCWSEIQRLIPDAILNGPSTTLGIPLKAERVANNLNISIPGLDAQMAVIALDAEGVAASTRSACNVGDEEPSHVIQAITARVEDPERSRRTGTAIRLTFLPDISRADAKSIAQKLFAVANRYRN